MRSKSIQTGILLSALALASAAHAQESPHNVTANVGLFSQYVFRGLTQTNERLAIQGDVDYTHASGIYAGTWLSNVSWYSDTNL